MQIKGSVALVTGVSSGIGAAIAKALVEAGAGTVILVARNEEALSRVAHACGPGASAHYRSTDVSKLEAVADLSHWIRHRFRRTPDIVINAAGSGRFRYLDEGSRTDIEQPMGVRFMGTAYVTATFLRDMLDRKSGHIVNITSPAAIAPWPGATGYAASCAAVYGLTRALRQDLRTTDVNTTLVIPGFVGDTGNFDDDPISKERIPRISKLMPILTAKQVAQRIVRAIEWNEKEVIMPGILWALSLPYRLTLRFMEYLVWKTGYHR